MALPIETQKPISPNDMSYVVHIHDSAKGEGHEDDIPPAPKGTPDMLRLVDFRSPDATIIYPEVDYPPT